MFQNLHAPFHASLQTPRRRIFIVRHAEREDNINKQWRKQNPDQWDNSILSDRGLSQCQDLRNYFHDIRIDSLYSSPFDRTMQTSSILLGNKPNPINVEPGLCEVLYMCASPPGFSNLRSLSYKFPRTNMSYQPAFTPETLPPEDSGDEALCPRVRDCLSNILQRDTRSENIVLVSHGATIAGLHQALIGEFKYVGQATISIFEEYAPNSFRVVTSGNTNHLSPQNSKNLRPW